MNRHVLTAPAVTALLTALCASVNAAPYDWNYPAPIKSPGANDNGKVVLFDVSHGGTEGNADWVIDGAFSDFADDLVSAGYTVQEYRGVDKNSDGVIQFVDDYTNPTTANSNANEAVITYSAIMKGHCAGPEIHMDRSRLRPAGADEAERPEHCLARPRLRQAWQRPRQAR